MFGIGGSELIVILVIALIVVGPKRLPELAKTIGKALGEFQKATDDLKREIDVSSRLKEAADPSTSKSTDVRPDNAGNAAEAKLPAEGTDKKAD
jgi:sec-independent protein translocase protein TatB